MYELKKIGKVFTSKFVGTGPSSYRTAVSQRLRNTGIKHLLNYIVMYCICGRTGGILPCRMNIFGKQKCYTKKVGTPCGFSVGTHSSVISLCVINRLVFITDTEGVYCAVRHEYKKIRLNFASEILISLSFSSRK